MREWLHLSNIAVSSTQAFYSAVLLHIYSGREARVGHQITVFHFAYYFILFLIFSF